MLTFICLVYSNFLCLKKVHYWYLFSEVLLITSDLDKCRTYFKAKWSVFAFIPNILIKSKYIQRNDLKTYPVPWRIWRWTLFLISYKNSQFICECVREFKWDKKSKEQKEGKHCLCSEFLYFFEMLWDALFRDLMHYFSLIRMYSVTFD